MVRIAQKGNVSTKRRMDMIHEKAQLMEEMCARQLGAFAAEMSTGGTQHQQQVQLFRDHA